MPNQQDLIDQYRDGFRTVDELSEWAIKAYRTLLSNTRSEA